MGKERPWCSKGFPVIALLLVGIMLSPEHLSAKPMKEAATFSRSNGRLVASNTYAVQFAEFHGAISGESNLLVAGPLLDVTEPTMLIAGLVVLIILLAASVALVMSHRATRHLEQEIEAKTEELRESHEKLQTTLDHLEAAHAFLQTIIDGVAEPIMVVGADYEIRLMNRAARNSIHGENHLSEPRFCYQVSHHELAPCKGTGYPCPMEQVRESGQPATFLHEHFRQDGERRFVEVIASPLLGGDGSFQGIIEAVRDITARITPEGVPVRSSEEFASDQLEQFSSRVVESIQDFFSRHPTE